MIKTKKEFDKHFKSYIEVKTTIDSFAEKYLDHTTKGWHGYGFVTKATIYSDDSDHLCIYYDWTCLGNTESEETIVPLEWVYSKNWEELYEEAKALAEAAERDRKKEEKAKLDALKKEQRREKYLKLKEEFEDDD